MIIKVQLQARADYQELTCNQFRILSNSISLELNSSLVKFNKPDVPNDSNVKLAVTVALINASLNSSRLMLPSLDAKRPAIVPAKESPQPVGSTTFSVGYAGNEMISPLWNAIPPFSPFLIIYV